MKTLSAFQVALKCCAFDARMMRCCLEEIAETSHMMGLSKAARENV